MFPPKLWQQWTLGGLTTLIVYRRLILAAPSNVVRIEVGSTVIDLQSTSQFALFTLLQTSMMLKVLQLSQDNDQDCKPVLSLKEYSMNTHYDFNVNIDLHAAVHLFSPLRTTLLFVYCS